MLYCNSCNDEIQDEYAMADTKPYHINHLVCDACKQTLVGKNYIKKDGIFYCEEDYYAFYAKICSKCKQIIK